MSEPFAVLFVCTANQCRSAMAEGLARHLLRREPNSAPLAFRSAGSHALPGSPATDGTMRAMRIAGIDLSRHRSRELDRAIVSHADLILTMTREHIPYVVAYDRTATRRTFTMARFARAVERHQAGSLEALIDVANEYSRDRPDDDIEDPVGRDDAAHQICAARLLKLMRTVLDALNGAAARSKTR